MPQPTSRPPLAVGPASRLERAAVWIWVAMVVGICARFVFAADPAHNNVYLKVFAPAGERFLAGEGLYALEGGFRYPPTAAALFAPFALAGPVLGSILWRLLGVVVLLAGVRAAGRAGFPAVLSSREKAVFLLLLALGVQTSLNNGQVNVLIVGALLLAMVTALRGDHHRAGAWSWLASHSKVYPIAAGMVLAVLRPRMILGLIVGGALVAALPFLLQSTDYVTAQYAAMLDLLRAEDRTVDLSNAYRDVRLLTAALGLPMPAGVFTALQLLVGASIAAACWWSQRRGVEPGKVFAAAFALSACWMLLFGPATEKATYALMAPSMAWSTILAWRDGGSVRRIGWVTANALVLLAHSGLLADRSLPPIWRCTLTVSALLALILTAEQMLGDLRRVGRGEVAAGRA